MAQPRLLLLAAWLALAGAAHGSFQVHVSPEAPVVEHGGSLWINCSHTCNDSSAPGILETSLKKSIEESGPGWTAFHLTNITQWASTLQCYVACPGENVTIASASLSTYRAPERVVLEPLPAMELGRAYNLTCRVLNVAPVRHLSVTLLRGGRALHTETFRTRPGNEPDSVTVTHEISPGRWDHGQQVTCQASLDLAPRGPRLQSNSSAAELRVYDKPRLDDSSCPGNRTWAAGTEQTLSCAALGNPPPDVACTKDGRQVSTTAPRRVGSEDAGTYVCEASNAFGRARREVTVHVEHPKPNYLLWVRLSLGLCIALVLGVACLYYCAHKIRKHQLNTAAENAPDPESSV